MIHVTRVNEPHHMWMIHVTRIEQPQQRWVLCVCVCMRLTRHTTHVNEPCHIRMSHVTYEWDMSHGPAPAAAPGRVIHRYINVHMYYSHIYVTMDRCRCIIHSRVNSRQMSRIYIYICICRCSLRVLRDICRELNLEGIIPLAHSRFNSLTL